MKVESPCVRNCCLDNHDICLGCFRHIDEIVQWRSLTEQEQLAVLKLCAQRKVQQPNNPYPNNQSQ